MGKICALLRLFRVFRLLSNINRFEKVRALNLLISCEISDNSAIKYFKIKVRLQCLCCFKTYDAIHYIIEIIPNYQNIHAEILKVLIANNEQYEMP